MQAVGKAGLEVRTEMVHLSRQEAEGESGRGNIEEGNQSLLWEKIKKGKEMASSLGIWIRRVELGIRVLKEKM